MKKKQVGFRSSRPAAAPAAANGPTSVASSAAPAALPGPGPGSHHPAVLADDGLDWLRQVTSEWRVLAITVVAVTLLATVLAAVQPKRYEASSLAAVSPLVQSLDPDSVIRGVDTLERRTLVATIAALASSPAARTAALGAAAADEDYLIDAAVLPNTNLIRVNVAGADRDSVTRAANSIPTLLSQQVREMYGVYQVTTVSPATLPADPVSPRIGRMILAGFLVGCVLGLLLAWAMAQRRLTTTR